MVSKINPIKGKDVDSLYAGIEFNAVKYKYEDSKPSWLLLGPSGGGKEGRGKYLLELFPIHEKLSSGDIFRNKILAGLSERDMNKLKEEGKKLGNKLKEISRNFDKVKKIFEKNKIKYKNQDQALAAFQTLNGLFVDDSILIDYASEQLKEFREKGVVLDGHIRTKDQVEHVVNAAKEHKMSIGAVLLVHTPLSVLEKRTVGRLKCPEPGCKRDYNTTNIKDPDNYPHEYFEDKEGLGWGKCHDHGHALRRRTDDYPDKVQNRLGQYEEHINEVLKELVVLGIPIYIVSGNLEIYSKDIMKLSVREALDCNNSEVMKRF